MVTMNFSKENQVITSTKRGRRRIGTSIFQGKRFLGLKYIAYINNYHWYL